MSSKVIVILWNILLQKYGIFTTSVLFISNNFSNSPIFNFYLHLQSGLFLLFALFFLMFIAVKIDVR